MSNTIIEVGKDTSNTRANDFTKRAKKSYNIDELDNELKHISKFGGVYVLSPYANLDDKGRSVFKIGMSLQLKTRCDNYLTYFNMVHFHSFIVGFKDSEYIKFKKNNPELNFDDNENNKIKKLELFRAIAKVEKELIDGIFKLDKKSRKLQFAQRGVNSEWIYTKSKYIDIVALELAEKYNLQHKGYADNYDETITKYYNDTLPDIIFCGKILFN